MSYCETDMAEGATEQHLPGAENSLPKIEGETHEQFLDRLYGLRFDLIRSGELPREQFIALEKRERLALEHRADHDRLSGLLKYEGYVEVLETQLPIIRQTGVSAYFGLFDGDKLKEVNDRIGKLKGNQLIQTYAAVLEQMAAQRPNIPFLLGRFAGDEFMVLVVDPDQKAAIEIFDEIRLTIPVFAKRALEMPDLESTISMGVVRVQPTDNPHTLFTRADKNLQLAKVERNKLYFEGSLVTSGHK